MKSIYFYNNASDWNDFCSFLQAINLDFYTYKGGKIDFKTLLSSDSYGNWFVLVPNGIVPTIDQYGQIDEFPDAIILHTSKKSGKILPAHLFCNEGTMAVSVFKKIKKYFSSYYLKTDSGKEYISETCLKSWLDYKMNFASYIKFVQISSTSENFSFEKFVEYFRQKKYIICDSYYRETGPNMSLKEDTYIITPPAIIADIDKLIGNFDGITIRRNKRKGLVIYTFTMDYRHIYHHHEKMLLLFNEIKDYCATF